ncbi:MAG: SPOR domain-containing protein [Methylococcales bacterium]
MPEQFSDQVNAVQQAEPEDFIADLITQERTQKLDLLVHLIINFSQSIIICGPKGIGKTTLLAVFQEYYAGAWPIKYLSATEQLSFEHIQVQLLKHLAQPGSGSVSQRLNILLRGFESFNRPVVLVCDNAGLMQPGLMTSLMQYAAEFPCLRIVFALSDDELGVKRSADPAIDSCYFIEIPALSETQCGEYLQQLSVQMEGEDTLLNFKKAPEMNKFVQRQLYEKTKGIPGRIIEALPDLSKVGGIKIFNKVYPLLIIGLLTVGAVFWIFKNSTSTVDQPTENSSQALAVAPLVIPGQVLPTPTPELTAVEVASAASAIAKSSKLGKPFWANSTSEPALYKGHGRSLEGDALTEFELNNQSAAIQAFEQEPLKVEIIPSESAKPELLVAEKKPLSMTTPMGGGEPVDAKAVVIDSLKIAADSARKATEAMATKQKTTLNEKIPAIKPEIAKLKAPKPLQAAVKESKKPAQPLVKLELVKKPKLNIPDDLGAAPLAALKPVAVAPKAKAAAVENATSTEPSKNQPEKAPKMIAAKSAESVGTQPTGAAQKKSKAIEPVKAGEVASEKPSGSRYTLQLMSFTQPALLADFMRKHSAMGSGLRSIKINKDGSVKYVVVYGTFESNAQANAAKQKLPAEFSQAWPRKM